MKLHSEKTTATTACDSISPSIANIDSSNAQNVLDSKMTPDNVENYKGPSDSVFEQRLS